MQNQTPFITEVFDSKTQKLTVTIDLLHARTEMARYKSDPALASKLLWWKNKKDGAPMPPEAHAIRQYIDYKHQSSGVTANISISGAVEQAIDYSTPPDGIPAALWAVLNLSQKKQLLASQAK